MKTLLSVLFGILNGFFDILNGFAKGLGGWPVVIVAVGVVLYFWLF
ncbi:MAG: hypothetical protein HOF75_02430 [Flavobacteriaceae bacterium]|jgi:hypothetical protein|nr:hypothetical protein [Flavobacteriaceae bacterium]